ncbi:arylsulfatase [soil metagenome]
MKPSRSLTTLLAAILLTLAFLPGLEAALEGKRPNIIFLLTDDQGYGDLSVHGNPVLSTPNFDKMHGQSLRFTNFMVSPTCAPTRSALLTGRHEFRNGVTHTILERERMSLGAITLAQVLKDAGYGTGIFGKWHLGDEEAYRPYNRGFEESFCHGGGGIGQTYPGSCGDATGNTYFDPAIMHNGTFEKTKGYCTDVFFDHATQWIESQKGKKPFFCWLATNAPHSPYHAKPEDAALYADKTPDKDTANFFGMIHNIDQNLGKLLAKLEEWGIAENTLVVAMNDNGGTAGVKVYNAGMRGGKGTPWIGGTRAFSFWRWPGTLKPADCDALTAHVDFFRTIAAIGGAKLPAPAEDQVEGRDLVPLLENPATPWDDRVLVSHVGRWPKGSNPEAARLNTCAIRNSLYTLVHEGKDSKAPWQLFDVQADPSQKSDVAAEHSDVVQKLSAAYDQWWTSIQPQLVNENATGPKINPFKELYQKQFGIAPSAEEMSQMESARIKSFDGPQKKEAKRVP